MTDAQQDKEKNKGFPPDHLQSFSDAVMAILITIMVLQLNLPKTGNLSSLASTIPIFCAYILSFVAIGIYWNNHHHLLMATKSISTSVMWANLHLLFWLSLVPSVTTWIGSHPTEAGPAFLYGLISFGAAVAFNILRSTIRRSNVDDNVIDVEHETYKGTISVVIYAIGMLLAFVNPFLGYAAYIIVSVNWLVPNTLWAGMISRK